MLRKVFLTVLTICILYTASRSFSGCAKEYSYEGGPLIDIPADTIPVTDTTVTAGMQFPFCPGCKTQNDTSLFWNFKFDTSLLCGNVTNAVITPERDGFTFFGPSTCSIDTGLVMTVFLNSANALVEDKTNIMTNSVSLQYYDNTTHTDIFISRRPSISFAIDSYNHSSGIAKGKFSGIVKTKDSTPVAIMAGNFAIQFK